MGFFGMSQRGKEANQAGWDWANSAKYQSGDWTNRSNDAYSAGKSATEWGKNWDLDRARNGVGGTDQIREYGSQIVPGIGDYVTNKRARLEQNIADYSTKVPQSRETMGKVNDSINETGDIIRQNRDYALNDIGDTFARANGYEDKAHGDVDTAYDTAMSDAELLKPSSQFAQAQTARSFAGMNASTAGGLRRAGIDLASPQGIAAMQRSQTAQARAMDDKAAQGTEKYVTNRQGLTLGKAGEATRHAGAMEGIDLSRSTRATAVQDKTTDRATDWEKTRQNAALLDRDLSKQDWQTGKDLSGELSNAELENIGLREHEFNAGMGYRTADLAEKNAGAQGVTNYGNNQQNYAVTGSNQARGWGDDAQQAYDKVYGREAANAGWGVKMLAGAAGGAMNMILPGSGQILTGAVNGAYGGGGGGGTYGGGYGGGGGTYGGGYGGGGGYNPNPYGGGRGGTPPFMPGNTGLRNPFSRPSAAYNTGNYSGSVPSPNYYNGGSTNPDGSFTVSR